MARLKGLSANLNAFLDSIAWAEGTSTSPITQDDGYDIIVTGVDGRERFDDYSKHPFTNRKPKQINFTGLYSSASGRYQHMRVHWLHYKELLKLPDFGPESQDRWAIQLIKERPGAIRAIEEGRIADAIKSVASLWASLPGAGHNQPERSFEKFLQVYLSKGGSLWDSKLSLVESLPSLPPSLAVDLLEVPKPNPKPQENNTQKMPNVFLNLIKKLLTRNQK